MKKFVFNPTPMGAGIADPPEQHPRWDGEKILPYDSVSGGAAGVTGDRGVSSATAEISEHRTPDRDARDAPATARCGAIDPVSQERTCDRAPGHAGYHMSMWDTSVLAWGGSSN